ncbi:MAG: alpha/beta fold hydrolase [Dehalococcoidales bacterium]|jgi:4,5:9,10-diseco-3-hydroxy-5,9,17-trioxoandrosta-1(10),2-diene-4-oate hydrolase
MLTGQLQDKFIKVGSINTRYWVAGDKGSAVVLVHGLGGFAENWVHNVEALAQRHRVYAMDLLGFGRTDNTPLVRNINTLVRFINDFMQAVNVPKAALVGNSLGGGLVLQFALDYPEKVTKLVLVDNAGMGRDVIFDFRLCSLPLLGELLIRPGVDSCGRTWKAILFDHNLITPELLELSFQMIDRPGAKKALLSALRAGIDLRGQRAKLTDLLLSRLGKITAPVLVVWGKEDRIIPVSHARLAVEKIPGAKLRVFDRCGHMPQFEHPEEFNRLVLDFLAE